MILEATPRGNLSLVEYAGFAVTLLFASQIAGFGFWLGAALAQLLWPLAQ